MTESEIAELKKLPQRLEDFFAEITDCIESVQGALRHRQQPQDFHFHKALKACRDGTAACRTAVPALIEAHGETKGILAEVVAAWTELQNRGHFMTTARLTNAFVRARAALKQEGG